MKKNQVTHEDFKKDLAEFLKQDIQKCCEFNYTKVQERGDTFMIVAVPEMVMEHKELYIEFDGIDLTLKTSYYDSFEIGYKYIEDLKSKYDIRPR